MKKRIDRLDWALVQAFLAVAETGSLSAAAAVTGASQPTLGRQVRAVEAALGLVLFRRHPRGLALSEAGAALLPPARAMREALREIAIYAAGHEAEVSGPVRITASEMVCHHLLPPVVVHIRAALPEVQVELVASDASDNLLYREADIAVRMYRPEQLDIVARHLGEVEMGIYAAKSYVARHGLPESLAALRDHDLVGYDRSELILRGMRQAGVAMGREDFAVRCDDQTVYWELLRAGCGIGFGQAVVARRDPAIVEIDLGIPVPPLPVWLAAHEGLRHTPRVRRVWDLLADGLAPMLRPVR